MAAFGAIVFSVNIGLFRHFLFVNKILNYSPHVLFATPHLPFFDTFADYPKRSTQ